jgi:uncharacterized protein (TIGR03086 family)
MRIVSAVRNDQLDLATPCGQWSLRRLLQHMIAHHRGFAAAAGGERQDASCWQEVPLGEDPRREYAEAAERVIEAFAADGVLEREFWLPEISPRRLFPAAQAIGFHFIDYVVHGWDVAAAIGVPAGYDDEVVEAALQGSVREVPQDAKVRERLGATFAPPVTVPDDAPVFDRMLAYLGRSPGWPH